MKHRIGVFLFIVLFLGKALCVEDSIQAYSLENGLELYVIEDFSTPVVSVNYACKAGTTNQSMETAGYFKLYSKLFWHNEKAPIELYKKEGCFDFSATCNADSSLYGFSVDISSLKKALNLFKNNCVNYTCSLENLSREYEFLKREVESFSQSSAGFINSAIDSRVFSRAPWKHDTGIYPSLFASKTTEELAISMKNIASLYYTPEKSALFITGPLKASEVLVLVNEIFSSWEPSPFSNTFENNSFSNAVEEHKYFVLVCDDISPSMNQLVIQFKEPGLFSSIDFSSRACIASQMLSSSDFTHTLKNYSNSGFISSDYIHTSFSQDGRYSRLIIQMLVNNCASPIEQYKIINSHIKSFVKNSKEEQYVMIKKDIVSKNIQSNPSSLMDFICANWSYGGIFYQDYFLEGVNKQQKEDMVSFLEEDPYVFLIVHPSTYENYKDDFLDNQFELITKDTANWYKQEVKKKKDKTKKVNTNEEADVLMRWRDKNLLDITEKTLKNGIPFYEKNMPSSKEASFSLKFSSKDLLKKPLEHRIRSIAVQVFSKMLKKELKTLYDKRILNATASVFYKGDIESNSVEVRCLSKDAPIVFTTLGYVLIYGNVSPALADECIFSQSYMQRLQEQNLDYQLYLSYLDDTIGDCAKVLTLEREDYNHISFNSVKEEYTSLLDASNIQIVSTGHTNFSVYKRAQEIFGLLHSFSIKKDKMGAEPKPVISNQTRKIRLHHTFSTTIPKEEAGPAPKKLIPTTDFADPSHLYLSYPPVESSDFIIYRALIEFLAQRIDNKLQKSAFPALGVSVRVKRTYPSFVSLRFKGVKDTKALKKLVTESIHELEGDWDASMREEAVSNSVRIHFSKMSSSSDMLNFLDESCRLYASITQPFYEYYLLSKTDTTSFERVYDVYLKNCVMYWLFSADSK